MNVGNHHSISISLHQTQIKGHELRYNYVNMFSHILLFGNSPKHYVIYLY